MPWETLLVNEAVQEIGSLEGREREAVENAMTKLRLSALNWATHTPVQCGVPTTYESYDHEPGEAHGAPSTAASARRSS